MSGRESSPSGTAEQLEDLLDDLHVALGDMRIYGPRHKVTLKRTHEAWKKVQDTGRAIGSLRLVSGLDGLSWDGVVVRKETDDREGLGRMLHREGIKAIVIQPDIDHQEFLTLLEVLRVNLSLPEYEEETLESLLWQAGIPTVQVEALKELQEAEILSGEAWLRGDADVAGHVIRELLDLRVDGTKRQDGLTKPVSTEALQRAIAGSDLSGLGGEGDGGHEVSEAGSWERKLLHVGARDGEQLAALRAAVAAETPGDLLARLILILLQVALEGRDDLPPARALEHARAGVDELFRKTLPGGVLTLLEEAPNVLRYAPPSAAPHLAAVQEVVAGLGHASRLGRMLLDLDPARHTDDVGLRKLVGWMPDAALEQVLELATREAADERRVWLLEVLGSAAQERFEAWLADLDRQPQERVVALLGMLRGLRSPAGRARRQRLMEHPSRNVRVAVLNWYLDDLPDTDVDLLLPSLADRHAGVRRATREVFMRHRHPKAYTWLRLATGSSDFAHWDPEQKRDVAISLGRIGGELGIDVLLKMLDSGTSSFFGGSEAHPDVLAAAYGLAAVGSLQAKMALKKGASSLNSGRRHACQLGLRALESGALR